MDDRTKRRLAEIDPAFALFGFTDVKETENVPTLDELTHQPRTKRGKPNDPDGRFLSFVKDNRIDTIRGFDDIGNAIMYAEEINGVCIDTHSGGLGTVYPTPDYTLGTHTKRYNRY